MRTKDFFPKVLHDFIYWNTPHARPIDDQRYMDILMSMGEEAIMTTPGVMHILNRACGCMIGGEKYLEIGTYRGSTLLGALLDNDVSAVVIDDRSEPLHADGRNDSVEWARYMRTFGMLDRITLYEDRYQEIVPQLYETDIKVGVAFLDGFNADARETLSMIKLVEPVLSDTAVIIIDDFNMAKQHQGAYQYVRENHEVASLILQAPTPGRQHMHPSLWNGIGIIAFERNTETTSG